MDKFNSVKRSEIMAKVKTKGTKPEIVVRSLLHSMGFRFRLHRKDLPGCPDIVLPRWRVAIFVHGCFWHGHKDCPRAARPTSNTQFWDKKLSGNADRDQRNTAKLIEMGWRPIVVWECSTRKHDQLTATLKTEITRIEQETSQ